MFNKVAIVSASVGSGHRRAAEALEQAFARSNAAREVRHLDALQYARAPYRKYLAPAYSYVVNHRPALARWGYNALNDPRRNDGILDAFDTWNLEPLLRLLGSYHPDLILCTHFLPASVVGALRSPGSLPRLATVVTDFDVHGLWVSRSCDRYFVATGETRMQLHSMGVPTDKISITGIPIDLAFGNASDCDGVGSSKHQEVASRPTLLVSAGRLRRDVRSQVLVSLAQLAGDVSMIVACGNNEDARNDATRIQGDMSIGRRTFSVVGAEGRMEEMLRSCDLVIGRPGGLITAEALAMGRPFAVVTPIPGQEERNADYLLKIGAGIRCSNLSALAYNLDVLLHDRRRLARMKERACRAGRPNAARDVVEALRGES